MARALIAVLLVLFASSSLMGDGKRNRGSAAPSVTEAILALSRDQNAAIQKHDRAALERIYAPEFYIVHAYGYVDSRTEHIDQLLARESTDLPPLPTFAPPDELNVYGDVAVYRYHGATTIGTPALGIRIYVKKNGQWQITQTQATEMVPPRKAASIDPSVFDRYAGRYDRGSGRSVVIAREGDTLVRILPGLPKVKLIPASETQFFDKIGAEWTFDRDATGRATAITQRFRDREWRATRVE